MSWPSSCSQLDQLLRSRRRPTSSDRRVLENLRRLNSPVRVTSRPPEGKGYKPAEIDPTASTAWCVFNPLSAFPKRSRADHLHPKSSGAAWTQPAPTSACTASRPPCAKLGTRRVRAPYAQRLATSPSARHPAQPILQPSASTSCVPRLSCNLRSTRSFMTWHSEPARRFREHEGNLATHRRLRHFASSHDSEHDGDDASTRTSAPNAQHGSR